jgi:putative acetyltransferase
VGRNEPSDVHVRQVRALEDFLRLHGLLLEYEAALPPELRHGSVGDVGHLRATYAEPSGAFVAIAEGDAAGCVALTELDEATALVLRLYVRESYRGLGIARSLVTAALALLRERGYRRVVLDTDKRQLSAAYDLYKALGFTECVPYGPVAYPNPTYMELVL